MRYLIYSMFIICALAASAQSNLVFFSEDGENFILYVNGAQSNEVPASRVKASGITGDFAQVKIRFETPGAPVIQKGMMLESGKEMTSVIKRNNKGRYVLRPVSVSAIASDTESEVVSITNSGAPVKTSPPVTQTTTTNESDNTETIGMSVNMGGQTVGMSVSMSGMSEFETNTSQTYTTTTSSTQTGNLQISARVEGNKIILGDGRVYTFNYYNANRIGPVVEMKNPAGASASISYEGVESYSSEIPFLYNEDDWKKSKAYFKLTVNEASGTWSVKLKHSGKIIINGPAGPSGNSTSPTAPVASNGCTKPMSSASYERSKASIQGKTFSDEQMTIFKQVVRSNCLSVNQVIGFIELFTYEEEKLDVAKLAYPKTVDKGNYYQVNDAFTYSDTIEELEDFLSTQ